jgi:multidrug efflux pump subunit AcrA (membrane-fusion protein)
MREGELVTRIRNKADFEIEAQIPAGYIQFVEQAGKVRAERSNSSSRKSTGNKFLQLIFRATLPEENMRTGTRTVRFQIANGLLEDLQADNTPVTLFVPTGPPVPVVTVPQDALIPVLGGHVVFVVEGDTVSRQRVRLGGTNGNNAIIKDGLAAGDVIVVKGNEGLSDGSKIQLPGSWNKNKNSQSKKSGQSKKIKQKMKKQ